MRLLKTLFDRFLPQTARLVLGDKSGLIVAAPQFGKGAKEREDALDLIAQHGMRAHYYLPAIGIGDAKLASAIRYLSDHGYIITTDATGSVVGQVATARPTSEELAKQRRASFQIVQQD